MEDHPRRAVYEGSVSVRLRDTAKRRTRQNAIMGTEGRRGQEREQLQAEQRAAIDPGAPGRAAIKRVGEYKVALSDMNKEEKEVYMKAFKESTAKDYKQRKKDAEEAVERFRKGETSYEEDFDQAVEEDEKNKLKNRKKKLDEAIDG